MCVCAQVLIPLYGCDCYAYGLLAAGFCDLVVEADMKPYDYMALVPIVQGAGGVITDWRVGFILPLLAVTKPCACAHAAVCSRAAACAYCQVPLRFLLCT